MPVCRPATDVYPAGLLFAVGAHPGGIYGAVSGAARARGRGKKGGGAIEGEEIGVEVIKD